ncbi:hypothetical protein C8255_10720 [filamentous cyanobacterium CCP3]|nr:hypothetical protein C8255_10720 [filamentous cyanobacterium CCP3]
MVDNKLPHSAIGFSIRSLEIERDPKIIHAEIQALCNSVVKLSGLEQSRFFVFRRSLRPKQIGAEQAGALSETSLFTGLKFEIPAKNFRVVLRCVASWLDSIAQATLFALDISPAHIITLKTAQAKDLAQLLSLGEALLPPQELYLTQAEGYVNTFGELTPAAKANLLLVRHRMGLTRDEVNDLNAKVMGPFKTLGEKYQHFRRELLVCKQESDLDSELWQVMQAKADTMGLPEADAQFLKAERLSALRREAERERQQREAEAEAERQRYLEQQQRLEHYRHAFESLVMDALVPLNVAPDADQFRQAIMAQLSGLEFNRGRLIQARDFYRLTPPGADTLEKRVLDELYLLSDLL